MLTHRLPYSSKAAVPEVTVRRYKHLKYGPHLRDIVDDRFWLQVNHSTSLITIWPVVVFSLRLVAATTNLESMSEMDALVTSNDSSGSWLSPPTSTHPWPLFERLPNDACSATYSEADWSPRRRDGDVQASIYRAASNMLPAQSQSQSTTGCRSCHTRPYHHHPPRLWDLPEERRDVGAYAPSGHRIGNILACNLATHSDS